MAEVEKSIQISYKADLKDLTAKLKQIPNLTDQEARKMVSALDRQLKQAEKAAKKSSDQSKKAVQAAAMAAARGAHNFDELEDSARRAEERLERVGDASGDIDRGFSSIGLALRGVNPQLAEAADGIADAFAVTEGLTMSFAALNPYVIAAAAAIGTLTLGYMSYQQEVEKARQLTLDMKEAQRSLNDSYKELRANFNDSLDKLGEIQDEYAVLTGEITEYELALRQTERQTKAMFQSNIDQQQTVIDGRKEELAMIDRMISANTKSVEHAAILSETEKERLHNLQMITDGVQKNVDLTKYDYTMNNELFKIRNALTNEIATQEKAMEIIVGHQEQAVDLALQIQEYENETKQAKEGQVVSHEKIVEKQEEEEDNLRNLIELDMERFQKIQDASNELAKLTEEQGLSEYEMKELNFARQLEHIKELGEKSGQQAEAQDLMNAMIAEKEKERLLDLQKMKEEQFAKDTANANALISTFGNLSAAMLDAAVDGGKANQKVINALFRMNQASSLAQIAFTTAENVVKAQGYPPPLNGIMSGLAIATGGAQAAVVMAQQPPQASFHMGGMAPDEMGARVLAGEAILDRATVQRIGGEQGVQQLQQGAAADSKIVVIQPFKHFGRFAKEIGFKAPTQTGLRVY
jgi:hypothetical protein